VLFIGCQDMHLAYKSQQFVVFLQTFSGSVIISEMLVVCV